MTPVWTRTCKICGKVFETEIPNKKCCSMKCSRINQKQHQRRWEKEHRLEKNELQRKRRAMKEHRCNICGEPILWTKTSRPVRHDECVLNEIVKSINAGNKLTSPQYQQLVARGYDIRSFREEYRSVLKYLPTVQFPTNGKNKARQ